MKKILLLSQVVAMLFTAVAFAQDSEDESPVFGFGFDVLGVHIRTGNLELRYSVAEGVSVIGPRVYFQNSWYYFGVETGYIDSQIAFGLEFGPFIGFQKIFRDQGIGVYADIGPYYYAIHGKGPDNGIYGNVGFILNTGVSLFVF